MSLLRRIRPAADRRRSMTPSPEWPHVVVLGGGFAGATAVKELAGVPARVTLVDRSASKTFQPLLYQVATAGLNPGDVTMYLRSLSRTARNLQVIQGEAVHLDPQAKVLTVDSGDDEPRRLEFDHLLLANGLTTDFFGTPGAEQHAMPMYTRPHAVAIRNRIFAELERTSRTDHTDALHVSIVGGGATGVELAGALADFRRDELSVLFPEMDREILRIRVIQRSGNVLKGFQPQLQEYASRELRDRGVELRIGAGVAEVGYDAVKLTDGTVLESDITLWAAGVSPEGVMDSWGLPRGKGGRIAVQEDLQVQGLPGIYAAGDVAVTADALPQQAQPALQMGRHAARMIAAEIQGGPKSAFRYLNLGTAATIGRRAAIIDPPKGPAVTGTLGWFGWMGVHVAKLMGHRNRLAVTANLLSLYGSFVPGHQPNPVTGEVDSAAASETFRCSSGQRRFGAGAQQPISDPAAAARQRENHPEQAHVQELPERS